jgi:hypothetical protein
MSSRKTTWLSLVALSKPLLPNEDEVMRTMSRVWPEVDRPATTSRTAGMVTLRWGEASAAYTLVPRPIPASQWRGPCATAWYWPEAADVVIHHEVHLLVTLVDEGRDAIQKALRLSRLTASAALSAPALAIFWCPAGLVHEPQAFLDQSRSMNSEDLPLYLWVDFRIEQDSDSTCRCFTTGLEAFDAPEIEAAEYAGDPRELLGHVYNVAHYYLTSSSRIKDGDTIGVADGVQLGARLTESMLDEQKQVIRLEYQ